MTPAINLFVVGRFPSSEASVRRLSSSKASVLTLRELEALTCFRLTVFFTLNFAGVTGKVFFSLQW